MANAPRPPKLKDLLLKDIGNVQRTRIDRPVTNKLKDVYQRDIGAIQRPQPRPFRTDLPR